MKDTGRITKGLDPKIVGILYGDNLDELIDGEMVYSTQVDRAHLVMLTKEKIVDKNKVKLLLNEINNLRENEFGPLRGKTPHRGIYLLYEDYLIEKLGEDIGGVLQTARSRNDLNATILKLRLRGHYNSIMMNLLELQKILIEKSNQFKDVIMPAYTHFQAAVPITYGHYLAGIASAIDRDIENIIASSKGLQYCPLGAGAVGGTSFPIDSKLTAKLLGFFYEVENSVDAVASRDLVLRLLSATSIAGITISRLATDYLLWTTSEFNFLSFPDKLVGSSSMMPNKRNIFILENIQGKSGFALGQFISSSNAMQCKPYTNSISVGTEGVKSIWKPLEESIAAIILMTNMVENATPNKENMLRKSLDGYTFATETANELVRQHGMSFRSAHYLVGKIVKESIENKEPFKDAAKRILNESNKNLSFDNFEMERIVMNSRFGGGPGRSSLKILNKKLIRYKRHFEKDLKYWAKSDKVLEREIKKICGS
ncbi:argininosuccinate lyase [Candidatus Woesearchaeota archaeon]|nr:argininosuccinate lyase [Candidatus Woesearchaeota archaeon]